MTTSGTRVVLADDDVLLREGLAGLLERSGFEVVGQGGNASELIELVREHRPELAIVDIRMPPSHTSEGLDAVRVIREEVPQTAILVLSAHVQVEQATDLLASGERSGYLLKSRVTDVDEFIETLERIVRGGSVIDPALVQELVAARHVEDPLDVLSPREREVLSLMAEGRSNAGIAHQLWIIEGTSRSTCTASSQGARVVRGAGCPTAILLNHAGDVRRRRTRALDGAAKRIGVMYK